MRTVHILGGAAAVAVAAFALGSPAAAHDTPAAGYDAVLKEQHHGLLATSNAFGRGCGEFGGSVPAGKEGWVFNVPSGTWDQTVGLKVVFDPPGDGADVTILIKTGSPDAATYPQGFGPAANVHLAWVTVPAGWTLKDGDGKTLGENTEFLITHSCLTTGSPSADPSSSASASASAKPSSSVSPSSDGTPTPSASTSRTPGDLPLTGSSLTGFVVAGLVMLAAGAALLAVRRRRDITEV